MSVKLSWQVWDRFPGKGSELLVFLALADLADDNGTGLNPSISYIAKKIRMSDDQTRRIIHKLIEGNYLVVTHNHDGGYGRGKTRHYRIKLESLAKCHPLLMPELETLADNGESLAWGPLKGGVATPPNTSDTYIHNGKNSKRPENRPEPENPDKDPTAKLVQSILDRSATIDEKNGHLAPLGLWIDNGGVNVMHKETGELYRAVREPVEPDNKQQSAGD